MGMRPKAAETPRRLGYCCINLSMDRSFRTMQLSWAERNPSGWRRRWREVVSHNILLLADVLRWNMENGVMMFRIGSDLIPFADHPVYGRAWRALLKGGPAWWRSLRWSIRRTVREYVKAGGRLSMHPAQFVSIGSPNPSTVRGSLASIEFHSGFMDELGVPSGLEGPVNIHVSNGTKGPTVVETVRASLSSLSRRARARLVFENEQSGFWTAENLLGFFPGVPVTLDYHHHAINPGSNPPIRELEGRVLRSWRGHRPLCHWSEGRRAPLDPAHSEMVNSLPPTPFDIEVEAKGKELAVLPFLKKPNRPAGVSRREGEVSILLP